MKSRLIAASTLLCLLAVGCGGTAAPQAALSRANAQLAEGRSALKAKADMLVAAASRLRLTGPPAMSGGYRSCLAGPDLVSYNYAISITPSGAVNAPQMSREVAGMLRSEGWRLVSVDFSKVKLALADTDHPLYRISQDGMQGAANILPYRGDTTGALIFMHSPCVNDSAVAATLRQNAR
jgi:hypothetical protein